MSNLSDSRPLTLFDKIWREHVVEQIDNDTCLIHIDRHLVHEVTSPQAFDGLRLADRRVRHPEATLAVVDHNVPTFGRAQANNDPESAAQMAALRDNAKEFGIEMFDIMDTRQGIVHVIGPEQGFTLPGLTIVCGDSHTSTHGAFGALAFGIGTSEVEHVLATQTLLQRVAKNMRVSVSGSLGLGVGAKDVILAIIGKIGTAGGTGHVIEYCGDTITGLNMAGRMTICNMSIEAGARAGMIAPDEKTFEFLKGRAYTPKGEAWESARTAWRRLHTDDGAHFDEQVHLKAEDIAPNITWGTSPEDVVSVTGSVPRIESAENEAKATSMRRALDYMGLAGGESVTDIKIDRVFIGSCTNARIEDLRQAAKVVKGRKIADSVRAMVVPGSGLVRQAAESEGLDKIFLAAGFEWRQPGCSMCLAMNADRLEPQERCASTSNRNFEGRQGKGGRTHLMSPVMAAAAACAGHITDVRQLADRLD